MICSVSVPFKNSLAGSAQLRFVVLILSSFFGTLLLAIPAPAKTFAYVTNEGSSSVSVIDTVTNAVVATVAGGRDRSGGSRDHPGRKARLCDESIIRFRLAD